MPESPTRTGDRKLRPDPVVEELVSALPTAVGRLYRRLRAEQTNDPIADSQRSVLALLVKEGPHTLGELSDLERVTPPSMNQTVNCLARAGYVRRKDDPQDGRKVILFATAKGVALIEETRRLRHAWLSSRLQELPLDQRQILSAAAEIIREVADS